MTEASASSVLARRGVPEHYELLLRKLAQAADELHVSGETGGRNVHLDDASAIVLDLLSSLDFADGGELVPRLAGLYGYIANELLLVARTRDRAQLLGVRDMITALYHSWFGSVEAGSPHLELAGRSAVKDLNGIADTTC